MQILIAEDDYTSREMLVAVVKKGGFDPVEAIDGDQAWSILQKPDAPGLIILDWMMPGIDGVEILRRVRKIKTERPPYIIMLTSKSEKSEIITGLDAGADDYLTKPFDSGELKSRLNVGRRMVEMQAVLAEKIAELQKALSEIRTLRGIVPICSTCKKIRDDQGYWNQVEAYVSEHTEAEFSHGVCPDCKKKLYSEFI